MGKRVNYLPDYELFEDVNEQGIICDREGKPKKRSEIPGGRAKGIFLKSQSREKWEAYFREEDRNSLAYDFENILVKYNNEEEQYYRETKKKKLSKSEKTVYPKCERVVDKWADSKRIGLFPKDSYFEGASRGMDDFVTYRINYFKYMDEKINSDKMTAPGKFGEVLDELRPSMENMKQKRFQLILMAILSLIGMLLSVGMLAEYFPQIPATLLPYLQGENAVNIYRVSYAIWIVTPILISIVVIQKLAEYNNVLIILAANLILTIPVSLVAVALVASIYFLGKPYKVLLIMVAVYFVILVVSFVLGYVWDLIIVLFKKPVWKKNFRKIFEANAEHLHRYVRLHILWWKNEGPSQELPDGVEKLQKIFNELNRIYRKC